MSPDRSGAVTREVDRAVALVTGASSGIGRAVAVALAGRGHALVLAGRSQARLGETGALLAGPWAAVIADMGRETQVQAMVDAALARFGRIDVLVNAAGRLVPGSIGEHTPGAVNEVLGVNAAGPAIAIARLWPVFVRQRSGCVINISSSVSCDGFGGPLAYAASKAALDMLTRCCAVEGQRHGIRAFSINPGPVETPMLRSFTDESAVPRSRAIDPAQIGALVIDCVEGRWNSRNGRTIRVAWHHPRGERLHRLYGTARRARRALRDWIGRRGA